MSTQIVPGVVISAPVKPGYETILTKDALEFFAMLQRGFNLRRKELLERRRARQKELDAGKKPDFLKETKDIRRSEWKVAPIPADLQDRRVEITGPVDRKMIINALNSGAKVFMADFEDSNSPTWENIVEGQINLRDAVRRTIQYTNPENNKQYALIDHPATLLVRPRGWHLEEKHVNVDGERASASIFDFAMYFFHNAKTALENGTGPYFYLPKMESHLEARLWNDVFVKAQDALGIPCGSVKATVLIETILAAFEMDEIIYELRDHMAGLNCGRWDYIFSFIKRFQKSKDVIFPDRAEVGMTQPFMRAYSQLAIKTCHRRGCHAIGGMAAQIPIKGDEAANQAAIDKVRADKHREANDGHDGTWVAHPGLVGIALEEFNAAMPKANQIDKLREDVKVTAEDILAVPKGKITEHGLRHNISVGIQYMAAWMSGNGCVPLYNLMEDAATAEISRAQIWQWINHAEGKLEDGRKITVELFRKILAEETAKIKATVGEQAYKTGNYELAAKQFDEIITNPELEEFLTLRAYEQLA